MLHTGAGEAGAPSQAAIHRSTRARQRDICEYSRQYAEFFLTAEQRAGGRPHPRVERPPTPINPYTYEAHPGLPGVERLPLPQCRHPGCNNICVIVDEEPRGMTTGIIFGPTCGMHAYDAMYQCFCVRQAYSHRHGRWIHFSERETMRQLLAGAHDGAVVNDNGAGVAPSTQIVDALIRNEVQRLRVSDHSEAPAAVRVNGNGPHRPRGGTIANFALRSGTAQAAGTGGAGVRGTLSIVPPPCKLKPG